MFDKIILGMRPPTPRRSRLLKTALIKGERVNTVFACALSAAAINPPALRPLKHSKYNKVANFLALGAA
jgi:hypothetical protein